MSTVGHGRADATLSAVVGALGAVLLGFGLLSMAHGALFALIGVRLAGAGISSTVIGLVMSAYFFGLLLGSLSADRIITRVGHIRAFAVFAATAAIAVLLLALWDSLLLWIGLRAAAGYCMAGLYMTMESWLNHRAANEIRGRCFAVYAVISGAAVAGGPLLLNLGDPRDFELFSLTAILFVAALLPVALTRTGNPEITRHTRLSLPRLFAISPLGVAGCMTAGLVNSSFYGMGAVYGQAVGLKPGAVSLFMTVTLVGGLLAQFPVGAFSDRMDRRRLMLILTLTAAAIAGVMAVSGVGALLPLAALGFLMDAAAHPLYGLSVAQTNDYVERHQFVPAAGGLLLAYGIGASLGPIVSSQVMEAMGPRGLFAFIMAALLLIAAFTAYRMTRRTAKPLAEQGEFIKVTQTTPVVAELDPRAPGIGAPRPENADNDE
ncbi:MAG: MFS transporter [Dongiaceae bacterium]